MLLLRGSYVHSVIHSGAEGRVCVALVLNPCFFEVDSSALHLSSAYNTLIYYYAGMYCRLLYDSK